MKSYKTALQEHLGRYAKERLGVFEEGTYKGKKYSHILPAGLKYLNILESIRKEVQSYLRNHPRIKLHQYFPHLNSSQAFAFNLFYPYFFEEHGFAARTLSAVLGVDAEVLEPEFEAVPDPAEGTNVDVMWKVPGGACVYCEVKLSEAEFGTAEDDARHLRKWSEIYKPRLESIVAEDLLKDKIAFKHYQLLRNIALLASDTRSRLVILMPRANEALDPSLQKVLAGIKPSCRERVGVEYIEDCLGKLESNSSLPLASQIHTANMREKYIPLSRPI